jgi:mycofactocin precursor
MADITTFPTTEATIAEPTPIIAETTEQASATDEHTLEEEIEEELIIEDFTIDGICGVY